MDIQQEVEPNKATNAKENPMNGRKPQVTSSISCIKQNKRYSYASPTTTKTDLDHIYLQVVGLLDTLKATKTVNVTPQKSVPLRQ